jgi:hypothetical protein
MKKQDAEAVPSPRHLWMNRGGNVSTEKSWGKLRDVNTSSLIGTSYQETPTLWSATLTAYQREKKPTEAPNLGSGSLFQRLWLRTVLIINVLTTL